MSNTKPLRVLHVIAWMDPKMGGVCQAVRTIISGLKEFEIENEVVSLDNEYSSFIQSDTFPIHALGQGKGPWAYNSKLLPWLIDNAASFNIIIMHGLWLYPTYAVNKAISMLFNNNKGSSNFKTRPKLFVMPHGMLDPYFQRAPGRKLKAIRNWVYWKLIEQKVINNADGVLFTSEEECKLAATTFKPYKPKQEKVVGLGVQEPPPFKLIMQEEFKAKCTGFGDNPYILFLSRIDPKKGVDILINAYAALLKKYVGTAKPESNFYHWPSLVIAGPGLESSYGKKMQRLVAESELLKSFVHFPGMLNGNAKWGAFYGCQAFILPSHQENFGIAPVEALACGKPVIISNQINIWREIIKNGAGLVENDTIEGTKKSLESWHNLTPTKKEKMSKEAITTYVHHFAITSAANKLQAAIK